MSKTIELQFDIGTKVYYVCAWGVESGTISRYEITENEIYVFDKDGCLLSTVEELHNNYDDAYEEWCDRFGKDSEDNE